MVTVLSSGAALAAAPAAAAGHACPSTPTSGATRHGHLLGIARPTKVNPGHCTTTGSSSSSEVTPSHDAGPYAGSPPLLDTGPGHGGPVMSTSSTGDKLVVTPVFWAPSGYSFTASYQSVIDTYLTNLAADSDTTTNVFASTYQYAGSNGSINYRMSIASPIVATDAMPAAGCTVNGGSVYADGSAYTTCIDDAQAQTELSTVISAHGLTNDLGHLVVLFLPKGVESCQYAGNPANQACSVNASPSAVYCAYHSAFGLVSAPKVYALMPFPIYSSASGYSCTDEGLGGGIQQPNGDKDADVEISPLSHEMAEAITDPEGNAWYDSSGGENGDDCAYIYGTLSGVAGAHYNQVVNGAHYLTQEEFSNADYVPGVSGCVQSISPQVPTVSSVSPSSGGSAGGGTVTITGTKFQGANAVHFGATASPSYTVNDPTSITATVPAGSAGTVDVTVSTAAGTSATVSGDHYTYTSTAPTVTSVAPTSGPASGGTSVTVNGTGFSGVTGVSFGGSAGTSVTVISTSKLTVTAPAHSAGTVDIQVTTSGGTSATSASDQFTYVAAPTVTSITPTSGPASGGTSVTVNGSNFTGVTGVSFGGSAGTSVSVANSSQLTVTAPLHAAGVVDVQVTATGGTSATSANDQFTYVAAPTVTSVSPTSGPTSGGTSVTVNGSNFTGVTGVSFGGSAGTSVSVVNSGQLTVTAPARAAGVVHVQVTATGGTSATSANDQFTYLGAPTVTSVSPNAGPLAGGTSVTVNGTGFTGVTGVSFGGSAGTNVNVVTATQLTVTAPAHAAGAVDIQVTATGGTSATSANDQFTYVGAPTVTSVSPTSGPTAGGTSVTVNGTGFVGVTGVSFGASAGTSVNVISATKLTVTAPSHAAGAVDIQVAATGGTSTTSANDQFTYVAPPAVTSVSPSSGPTGGTTAVVITGTNLTGVTAVNFGANAAAVVTPVSATEVDVSAPAGAGTVDVTVVTPYGTSATSANDHYTYVGAPTVTSVSPSAGPLAGGTSVTVTGSGFSGVTGVSFGTGAGTSVNVISATQLTVTAPSHAAGVVDVQVSATGGTSATSANDQFTYLAAPTVTSVSPTSGPLTAGTAVTVTGTGFTGVTGVSFGAASGTAVNVVSTTQLTVTAPAHSAGAVDVQVTAAGGTSPTSANDHFTFVAPPTVTSVAPSSGPTGGATAVVITGTNLSGATAVSFGGNAAAVVTPVSATEVDASAPAGTVGTVDVTVTTPYGTSATSASDHYTYVAAPTVTSVAPGAGPVAGGTSVTVTGTGFTGVTGVSFGGASGTAVNVVSTTQLTVTAPAHAAGAVDVQVTATGGTSATSANDQFTYVSPPTVTSVSPSSGSTAGGTAVAVTGSNLGGTTAVSFGGQPATGLHVVSATEVDVTSPAAPTGTVDVTVLTPGGTSATSANDQFSYLDLPAVTNVSPASGPAAGGTTVTVSGANFNGVTGVSFAGNPGSNVNVVSPGQLTVTAPAGTAGAADVTVSTLAGTSATSASDQFTYVAAPAVTAVSPNTGPTGGGRTITVTGTGFAPGATVSFGGSAGTGVTVLSPTSLTVVSPAHPAATVDVTVSTVGGASAVTASDHYRYLAAPTVTRVSPTSGPTSGGQSITITGSGYVTGATVSVGGVAATSVVVVSATSLTAHVPAHAGGTVDVRVTTAGGTSAAVKADHYTYLSKPKVSGLSVTSGTHRGGRLVSVRGAGFVPTSVVRFGTVVAHRVNYVSSGKLKVYTPRHVKGRVHVTVTTAGGRSRSTKTDRYRFT